MPDAVSRDREMREKATVRLVCIITGVILAAFLVPLVARARSTSPRPVEAPGRSAAWSGWKQISNNANDKGMQFSPALAVQDSKVYAMWSRQVGSSDKEYDPSYTSSADNGDNWGLVLKIQSTTPTSNTVYVDMALDSTGAPHFVWSENTVTPYSYTLYYSSTYISAIQVITQYNGLLQPAIAVGSTNVHVVWLQGATDIMHNSKAIASGAWDPGSATNVRNSAPVQDPNIAVDSSDTVHVVWSEENNPTDTSIKYKNSNNWAADPAIVYEGSVAGDGMGYRPDIAVSGSNVYVVWCAYKDAEEQYVRFGQSTNGGSSWSSSELISGGALAANSNAPMFLRPGIAVDTNGKIHVAFNGSEGTVNDTEDIFYVSKTQDGSWRTRQNVTSVAGQYNNTTPAIATEGEYVHLIWARQNWETNRYEVWYSRASIVELEGVFLPIILKSYP